MTSRPPSATKTCTRPRYCEKSFNKKRQRRRRRRRSGAASTGEYRGGARNRENSPGTDTPGPARPGGAPRPQGCLEPRCGCAGHNLIGFSRIQREKGEERGRARAGSCGCCQLCAPHIQFSSFSVWSSVWCKPRFSSLA